MADREEMSRSFGAQAHAYEAGRPEYPVEAVAWLLAPVRDRGQGSGGPTPSRRMSGRVGEQAIPPRVVDVGAGTGKLTRVVSGLGAETIAVEPDAAMREVLRAEVPGVPALEGTAESIPLADTSVDAVVLGQAWHWVDVPVASREAARVLRPGGLLGLIWNVRDERVEWVARLTAIVHASSAEIMMGTAGPTVAAPFGAVESERWEWARPMTRATLSDMVHSRSYFITAGRAEQARIETELDELFDETGLVGEAVVDMPYVTRAFRAPLPR